MEWCGEEGPGNQQNRGDRGMCHINKEGEGSIMREAVTFTWKSVPEQSSEKV